MPKWEGLTVSFSATGVDDKLDDDYAADSRSKRGALVMKKLVIMSTEAQNATDRLVFESDFKAQRWSPPLMRSAIKTWWNDMDYA